MVGKGSPIDSVPYQFGITITYVLEISTTGNTIAKKGDLLPFQYHTNQPFTEPIITPLSKYFCRNGYRIISGREPITMTEYLIWLYRFA